MKTQYVAVLNHEDRRVAEESGLPIPEEKNGFADCWIDLTKSSSATSTKVRIVDKEMPVFRINMDDGGYLLIPDNTENRKSLDLRFNRMKGLS